MCFPCKTRDLKDHIFYEKNRRLIACFLNFYKTHSNPSLSPQYHYKLFPHTCRTWFFCLFVKTWFISINQTNNTIIVTMIACLFDGWIKQSYGKDKRVCPPRSIRGDWPSSFWRTSMIETMFPQTLHFELLTDLLHLYKSYLR